MPRAGAAREASLVANIVCYIVTIDKRLYIYNPQSAAAPHSGVLIGWTNGLLMSQPELPSRVYCTILWVHVACHAQRLLRSEGRAV